MRMRKWSGALLAGLLLLVGTSSVAAQDMRQGDQCVIPADETIEGNLFVLCRVLLIDGTVEGNVVGAASNATLNGTVRDSIYLIGGQLDTHGTIGADVHFAGPVLVLHPTTTLEDDHADLFSASLSTSIGDGVNVSGSLVAAGYQMLLNGDVGDHVNFWGSALTIGGSIDGNVEAQVGDSSADISQLQTLLIPFALDLELINPGLKVQEAASVAGQLRYSGPTSGEIDGSVEEEVIYTPVIVQPDFSQIRLGEENESSGIGLYFAQIFREMLALSIIGIVGLLVAPRTIQAPLANLRNRPLPSLGLGMVTFILSFPFWLVLFVLGLLTVLIISLLQWTELTIASSVILTVFTVSCASIFYFVAIFLSRVLVCIAVGLVVMKVAFKNRHVKTYPTMTGLLIGVVLLAIIHALPLIGWVVNALAAFIGSGAILLVIQERLDTLRKRTTAPYYHPRPRVPASIASDRVGLLSPPPPPIIEDEPRSIGMENLPEGFQMWED